MVNIFNTREYVERFLYIRTKDGAVVPLRMNRAQRRLYDKIKELHSAGKPIRIIILKARQLGFSTITEGIMFKRTATKENTATAIITHQEKATASLFRMNKLFYDRLPDELRPMVTSSNAQEIIFDNPEKDPEKKKLNPGLGSRIRCYTAGGAGIGRSETYQNVHASEFAFWPGDPKDTWVGIIQSVPALPGTMVIIESTPNGFNEFKKMWDAAVAGENDFVPLFFPWFENHDYSMAVPPGTEWTPEERELKETYALTEEQLAWRRWCIQNNCSGDAEKFHQEYPSCPEEAFLSSGRPVFNNRIIMQRMKLAPQAIREGVFIYDYDELHITNIRFQERTGGPIRIFAEPEERVPYVLGGDTAGEGSDRFTACVIDNITSEMAATFRETYDEPEYARQMYCLGMYYNTALIGIETNYSTYPVMELQRLKYPKQYVREALDTYTGKHKKSYGWVTSPKSRPVIIAEMQDMFKAHAECFRDNRLFEEMLVFSYNEGGKAEALEGEHDDMVLGTAICYGIRGQQRYTRTEAPLSRANWTESMKEDYRNANREGKAELLRKWSKEGI